MDTMEKFKWEPPKDWLRIKTIDAHTAGEPLRVIVSGFPKLHGETILEKRYYAKSHYDNLRKTLLWEPRGHADMYGCIITDPVTKDGDFGVLFMHNEGFSTMCGHGVIGLTKVVLETGMLQKEGDFPVIKMDTPAGRVTATARRENGKVVDVSFVNVPSFVYAHDQVVEVPGLGNIHYDIAFGGAFYAFCKADEAGVELTKTDYRNLIQTGMRIKRAIMSSVTIEHPFEKDLSFLYGTIFIEPPHKAEHHSRNVCIFADGEVDRCPTGTGVSARAAIYYSRGEIGILDPFIVESILGTTFTGEVVEVIKFGGFDAVIPKVTGSSYIIGVNTWLIDPDDPLSDGFLLR